MLRFTFTALVCALALTSPALAAPAADPPLPPEAVFPVLGKVHFGDHAARFGGSRDHQGQDVFADCGTPMVAAAAGRMRDAKYHGAAGHYVVIRTEEGREHFYAHLRLPAAVEAGERVEAGQRLGSVGDSGNAWDCHLHFEIWTAPGWYRGGHAIDPLPYLRRL